MTTPVTDFQRTALLGNHLPRQCGIATFTTDLANALSRTFPALDCPVVAVNDPGNATPTAVVSVSKSPKVISRLIAVQRTTST